MLLKLFDLIVFGDSLVYVGLCWKSFWRQSFSCFKYPSYKCYVSIYLKIFILMTNILFSSFRLRILFCTKSNCYTSSYKHIPNLLLRFSNWFASRAFVKMSASCNSMATCYNVITFSSTRSLMKWCLMLICLVLLC